MLNGKINYIELYDGGFWVECLQPPYSGCCTVGKQYPVHIEHEDGHVYFILPWNDNNEPFLLNLSTRHTSVEGVFEVIR